LTFAVRKIGVHKQIGKTRLRFYDYSHFTPENISQVFSNINWNPVIVSRNCDAMVSELTNIFKYNIYKLVKPKTRFVKSKIMPPWLDEEVRSHMKIRDNLKDKAKWKTYKRERNLVTNMINRKKKSHFENLVKTPNLRILNLFGRLRT
jgi:hypothetical protein